MTQPLKKELHVAIEAVKQAIELCQTVRAELVTDETIAKKDRSPVTVADFGAQAIVAHALLDAFPDVRIVGEEDANALRDADNKALKAKVVERVQAIRSTMDEKSILDAIDHCHDTGGSHGVFWTLDPIDGTKGFLRGEQYAIALARIENGQVTLGVLGCPNLPLDPSNPDSSAGCIFYAVLGEGAFIMAPHETRGRQVHTSKEMDSSEAVVCEPVEAGHTRQDQTAKTLEILRIQKPPLRMDSQCKYAAVARGQADIYLRMATGEYEEKIWDHAAGCIIIEEAGGNVCDIAGRPLDFGQGTTLSRNRGIIAANGPLQIDIIDAVRQVMDLS